VNAATCRSRIISSTLRHSPLGPRGHTCAHALAPEYHAVASERAVRLPRVVTMELSIFRESGRIGPSLVTRATLGREGCRCRRARYEKSFSAPACRPPQRGDLTLRRRNVRRLAQETGCEETSASRPPLANISSEPRPPLRHGQQHLPDVGRRVPDAGDLHLRQDLLRTRRSTHLCICVRTNGWNALSRRPPSQPMCDGCQQAFRTTRFAI